MVRIFINMGTVNERLLVLVFMESGSSLWCIARLLLEQLFVTWSVVSAAWSNAASVANR